MKSKMFFPKLSSNYESHIRFFKIFGIWSNYNVITTLYILSIIYCTTVFSLFIIAPQFCHVVFMYKAKDNVVAFADEFYVSMSSLMVVIKDYTLMKNKKNITNMLQAMDSEILQPSRDQHLKVHKVFSSWKRLFPIMITLQAFFSFAILVSPFIDLIKTGRKAVPLVDCYPFYIYNSPIYELMYIYQVFVMSYLVIHSTLFVSFIVGLITFCSTQCDILYKNVMSLKSEIIEKNFNKKLLICIKHHEEILRFVTKLEKCFSVILFAEYFSILISSCTTMFKLSMAVPMTLDFFKVLVYISINLLQMFLYCWTASELTEKSGRIPNAIYYSFKPEFSKSTKTNLKIFIGKTQIPLKLSTPFFQLSMAQYLELIRSSFSYYTILTSLNEKNK